MKLSQVGELSLLEQIRKEFRKKPDSVIVGIGDDASVLKPFKKNVFVTTDMMIEGVHFDLSFITPYQLGFKIISINVSDIFAMGGKPDYVLLNVAVKKNTEKKYFNNFFDGVKDAMERYRVVLIGGDISSTDENMSLSATIIGSGLKYITRSGAKVGERIYVTGNLGDSSCGLELLKRLKRPVYLECIGRIKAKGNIITKKKGMKPYLMPYDFYSRIFKGLSWNSIKPLLKRHLLPVARDSKKFLRHATSMIDISDGLLIDLTRICDESKVGARIYLEKIPISSEMRQTAKYLGVSPVRLALSGGEDYEMLFTASPEKKVRAVYIGNIVKSERVIIDEKGRKKTFSSEGYQHFKN